MLNRSFRSRAFIKIIVLAQCLLSGHYAEAHEGWGIVVDHQGHIFFSDIPNNTIWRIKPGGKPERFLTNKHSHALVLGNNGSIYGTHEHHAKGLGSVWNATPDGTVTIFLSPHFNFPLSLHPFIMDKANSIYSTTSISFVEQRDKVVLMKATTEGKVTFIAGGKKGFKDGTGTEARFIGIDGMAWANDTTLLVTDGPYLRQVSIGGKVTTIGTQPLTEPSYGEDLMGLCVGKDGSIYMADYSGGRLLKQIANGSTQNISETGFFWSPTGVTTVTKELYVMDCLKMPFVLLGDLGIGPYIRIRKISVRGEEEVLGTVWGRNTLLFVLVLLVVFISITVLNRHNRRKRNTLPEKDENLQRRAAGNNGFASTKGDTTQHQE